MIQVKFSDAVDRPGRAAPAEGCSEMLVSHAFGSGGSGPRLLGFEGLSPLDSEGLKPLDFRGRSFGVLECLILVGPGSAR